MNLSEIENHFKKQMELMGNLADEDSFQMIFTLIEDVRLLESYVERVTALNRHYLNRFYGGNVLKMQADFKYIGEQ